MVCLSIPASLSYRDLVLAAVLTAVSAQGGEFGGEVCDELTSALCEAFNNIVLHAYSGVQGGRVDVRVIAGEGEVEIEFSDHGRGFDFDNVPVPDIGDLPEGGMGIFIMRSFMDEVEYTRGWGGKPNVLLLRKRWSLGDRPAKSDAAGLKREASQSGWRMRSVAVPASDTSTAGSLRRK